MCDHTILSYFKPQAGGSPPGSCTVSEVPELEIFDLGITHRLLKAMAKAGLGNCFAILREYPLVHVRNAAVFAAQLPQHLIQPWQYSDALLNARTNCLEWNPKLV
jgi:hypothetical protein